MSTLKGTISRRVVGLLWGGGGGVFVRSQKSSCLVTDSFGLSTEIAVCKFLCCLAVIWPQNLFILSIYFIHFSASFFTAHCVLDLARNPAP